MLLATGVDHSMAELRRLTRDQDTEVLAPGLLAVYSNDVHEVVASLCRGMTPVETAEVRCLIDDIDHDGEHQLLLRALRCPSLAVAGARVRHADLLPLFADELRRFHSVYQPIVRLADGGVVGHEALLRATTEDGAPVMPDVLFPAAEAAGWTHLLDRVGRTTALHGAGSWLGKDLLFINFIPTSIYRPEACLRTTISAARRAHVDLGQIVFEVTESHQVHDLDHLQRVFDHYKRHGCKVALDDVGAGFSSLTMLIRLQPDIVKIDRAIVEGLPDAVNRAAVAAIVDIAAAFGGVVLAEGIETAEQAEAARELGVTLGQGWHFGRPVLPPRELAQIPAPAGPSDEVHPLLA